MRRIVELDGVRGIAILQVLLWHYFANQALFLREPAWRYLRDGVSLAWSGVDLFFVLSGFLIVGILLDTRGLATFFKRFYVRRACRILPLYLALVGTYVAVVHFELLESSWLLGERLPLLSYLTFTQNFFMHYSGFGPHWLAITWSLAIEEQFYLVIPFLVFFLNQRVLLFVFAGLILAAPVVRFLVGGPGAFVLPFARSDAILLGGALAIAVRRPEFLGGLESHKRALWVGFWVSVVIAHVVAFRGETFGGPLLHAALASAYALLLVLALVESQSWFGRILRNRVLIWFGLRSFGIYLIHQAVSGIFHQRMNGTYPSFHDAASAVPTIFSLATVVVMAELSFRFFEKPFLRLGQKWTRSRHPDRPIQATS